MYNLWNNLTLEEGITIHHLAFWVLESGPLVFLYAKHSWKRKVVLVLIITSNGMRHYMILERSEIEDVAVYNVDTIHQSVIDRYTGSTKVV
jgi:hypothetical protein